ncbi:PREDICTED: breast cancer metastasis-suppressor 1-like protein isoform X3 [Ceratosolen solmsi marchali]|nr:PREDICTED: breast cancer metastasis-suppressor 1-like protein isoform X3 [Ceratosolen solmsi marchali]XP_011505339.1 PREDICTED: breast cancer metastasis-suppressor 1-like protein isoform X3 [Ceratosolen solmsi marchali]XP_011505340.1 PREDICTED: breast cancer metastasis-suppressor 1-like protein isoform X3 [Ceratosolen solmsi marchali]
MPSTMKDESEAEGDEMSHISNDSNATSSSSESSEENSDSDDSSEMDEDECEQRKIECLDNLVDLERQFYLLREKIYEEKISQIEKNLIEIRAEKSEDYLKHVEHLKEIMKTKEAVAEVLKKYRLDNISNLFLSEELAAAQNLDSEKGLLWDDIQGDLQEKIRRLEEDRNSSDIHTDLWLYSNGRRRKNRSQRRRAVAVTGPYIVYMLNDAEILEDWALIKKSLTTFKTEIL